MSEEQIDPNLECPDAIDAHLIQSIEKALQKQHRAHLNPDEKIWIQAFTGAKSALLRGFIGTEQKAHVFEFFARGTSENRLDGTLGLLLDYFDGVLAEFFHEDRDAWLPLDFTCLQFDGKPIFVRHELRNFGAEKLADEWLQEHDGSAKANEG